MGRRSPAAGGPACDDRYPRDRWRPVSPVVVADADELARVYRDLLVPAFTPAELVPFEEIAAGVASGQTEVLVRVQDGQTVAVAVGDFFARAALLSYLAVAPRDRGGGHGGALLLRATERWRQRGDGSVVVLAEVAGPGTHPPDPLRGDPTQRVRFYGRHGARRLDVPYFQPSLGPGLPRVHGMMLLALHVDTAAVRGGRLLDPAPVVHLMEEYFRSAEGRPRPDDDDARALFASLEQAGGPALLAI